MPAQALEATDRCILVGWSMGGSSALRLATRFPEKIAGLVLIAATPRMMEDKATGWRGMTPHRLEALRYGLLKTQGIGFFGVPEGKPNPYLADDPANLERGLQYLLETDVRKEVVLGASCLVPSAEQKEVPGASCFVLRAGLKHKDGRESNAPSTKHQHPHIPERARRHSPSRERRLAQDNLSAGFRDDGPRHGTRPADFHTGEDR